MHVNAIKTKKLNNIIRPNLEFFFTFAQVILFFTTLFVVSFCARQLAHASSTQQITRVVLSHSAHEKRHHPCKASITNSTVLTGNRITLCMVPTEEELREQLKTIGGLNKHYAAVTKEEADKFVTLLPPPRPTPPREEAMPFPIIWSHLSSAVSRNRRAVSRRTDQENNIVSSRKTRCIHRGDRTEIGMVRLCSECQRISRLSSDRFPRYINEVACSDEKPTKLEENDSCCNKNNGMCIQRFLFMDFLVRTENYEEVPSPDPEQFPKAFKQVWEPYTQKIRSCCECQLW